ncbi:MAG: nitroreductase family protein [Patescibacteria group bacterium]
MTKDVIDAIKERRTIRKFAADPLPEATIGRLIEAARCAPSAGNIQPWHFSVVLNGEVRRRLAEAAHGQEFLGEAPVCVVVSAEPGRSAASYGRRGESLYCLQDTAAAVQNMLLAATGYGLGSAWVGAFDEEAVREAANLPESFRPVALVALGHPAEEGEETPLRAQEEVAEIIH